MNDALIAKLTAAVYKDAKGDIPIGGAERAVRTVLEALTFLECERLAETKILDAQAPARTVEPECTKERHVGPYTTDIKGWRVDGSMCLACHTVVEGTFHGKSAPDYSDTLAHYREKWGLDKRTVP